MDRRWQEVLLRYPQLTPAAVPGFRRGAEHGASSPTIFHSRMVQPPRFCQTGETFVRTPIKIRRDAAHRRWALAPMPKRRDIFLLALQPI
jgi:hypothetical protein